jgi:hypothetical protein
LNSRARDRLQANETVHERRNKTQRKEEMDPLDADGLQEVDDSVPTWSFTFFLFQEREIGFMS